MIAKDKLDADALAEVIKDIKILRETGGPSNIASWLLGFAAASSRAAVAANKGVTTAAAAPEAVRWAKMAEVYSVAAQLVVFNGVDDALTALEPPKPKPNLSIIR